jgi:hypothetical protein
MAAVAFAIGIGLASAPADAVPAPEPVRTSTDPAQTAAGWLTTRLVDGNHVTIDYGGTAYDDLGTSADVVFALAAVGVGRSSADAILDYLTANIDSYAGLTDTTYGPYAGSAAKAALALLVGGRDPAQVSAGGLSLTDALATSCPAVDTSPTATHYCPAIGAGMGTYSSIAEAFIVLTSARLGTPLATDGPAMTWFRSLQCPGGGFTSLVPTDGCDADTDADADATAYAVLALSALPSPSPADTEALDDAVAWLLDVQNADGSWTSQGVHSTDSTGLAAAALAAVSQPSASALSWLTDQQITDGATTGAGARRGALAYAGGDDEFSVIKATADGLLGLGTGALGDLTLDGAVADAPLLALAAPSVPSQVAAGATITVRAGGLGAGEPVHIILHSDPVVLATVTATATGAVTANVTIPRSTAVGAHQLEVVGQSSTLSTVAALSVTSAPTSTDPSSTAGRTGPTSSQSPLAATGPSRASSVAAPLGLGFLICGFGLLLLGRRPSRH